MSAADNMFQFHYILKTRHDATV